MGSKHTLQSSGLDFAKLMSKEEKHNVVEESPIVRTLGSRQSSIQVLFTFVLKFVFCANFLTQLIVTSRT